MPVNLIIYNIFQGNGNSVNRLSDISDESVLKQIFPLHNVTLMLQIQRVF